MIGKMISIKNSLWRSKFHLVSALVGDCSWSRLPAKRILIPLFHRKGMIGLIMIGCTGPQRDGDHQTWKSIPWTSQK